MKVLPLFHRVAGQPVIVLGEGPAADAKRHLVERAGAHAVDDHPAARLAFVALDDPAAIAHTLRARGILVNVVDRPELCDFTVPSLLDREPLIVAVGTGGASAGLAKHVRLRLERLLPPSLGQLGSALHDARDRLRVRWPEAAERRRQIDEALAEGAVLDPLAEDSAARVEAWLQDEAPAANGQVFEFALASDDPDDLTLRQARLLGIADVVCADPVIAPAILNRARADAVRLAMPPQGGWPDGVVVVLRRS